MKKIFVTATGTDIGKTLISQAIIYQNHNNNIRFLKPVISGYTDNSDTHKLINASGQKISDNLINEVSPYRFIHPISPNIAAKFENKLIDYNHIVHLITSPELNKNKNIILVEGAGGIMSPITDYKTNLDLIKDTNFEVILVSGTYLGAISHLLTSYEILKYSDIRINKIILSTSQSTNNLTEVIDTISNFINDKIIVIPRLLDSEDNYQSIEKIYL